MCKNKQKIIDEKEFYNVKKAGEKLFWRLSPDSKGEYKHFKPNENDFKALKSVLGMINRIKKNNVSNNVLFGKLCIYFLTQSIRHNETTIFNGNVQLELARLLDRPFGHFVKAFTSDLHTNQINKITIKNFEKDIIDINKFKETFNDDYNEKKLTEIINTYLLNLS